MNAERPREDRCGACGGEIVEVIPAPAHVFGEPNWRHANGKRCPGPKGGR